MCRSFYYPIPAAHLEYDFLRNVRHHRPCHSVFAGHVPKRQLRVYGVQYQCRAVVGRERLSPHVDVYKATLAGFRRILHSFADSIRGHGW